MSFDPTSVGWRLGRSVTPWGVELWVRADRTAGVYGVQGSGKTLDLLAPALLAHPGAAMATLTKLDDLVLTLGRREAGGRPVAVLDPFGMAPGLPELVWDPIAGCVDPLVAERRAKAFSAGTVTGAVAGGRNDNAARFYAAETAKVLQGFFHAAALTGRSLHHVLEWVANPVAAEAPAEILRRHPHAAQFWDGLLAGALHGSADTVANTVTTVQQALSLFFQPSIRGRCTPSPGRPGTDLADLLARGGTVYLLGREDPYASAAPLMTAVAEHLLDTALALAARSPHGRVTPSFLACLDELPSQAPIPTLRTRMANERALGHLVHLRRPDLAADGRRLRRGRGPQPVRADQQRDRVRRRQRHPLLPGDLRPARHHPRLPANPERRARRRRHLPGDGGHPDPAPRASAAAAGTASPRRRRERPADPGQTAPLHRRPDRPGAARRAARRPGPGPRHPRQRHRRRGARLRGGPLRPAAPAARPRCRGRRRRRPRRGRRGPVGGYARGVVVVIVTPFPMAPRTVRQALHTLAVLRSGDAAEIKALGDLTDLPRPWNPGSCDDELRPHVWRWCDAVAMWINREYGWRPAGMIPACWPAHPHLAHELPVLACLRLTAENAYSPELLEDWHRTTLPLFLDRMTSRLGDGGCRSGKHTDWPAASRYDADTAPDAVAERERRFDADTRVRPPPGARRY